MKSDATKINIIHIDINEIQILIFLTTSNDFNHLFLAGTSVDASSKPRSSSCLYPNCFS